MQTVNGKKLLLLYFLFFPLNLSIMCQSVNCGDSAIPQLSVFSFH